MEETILMAVAIAAEEAVTAVAVTVAVMAVMAEAIDKSDCFFSLELLIV